MNERAEVAGHLERLRDRFTTGTARAVGSGPTVMELVLPFLAAGGLALLQRGKLDETERAAMSDAGPMLAAEVEAEVPAEGRAPDRPRQEAERYSAALPTASRGAGSAPALPRALSQELEWRPARASSP